MNYKLGCKTNCNPVYQSNKDEALESRRWLPAMYLVVGYTE